MWMYFVIHLFIILLAPVGTSGIKDCTNSNSVLPVLNTHLGITHTQRFARQRTSRKTQEERERLS